MEPTPQRHLAPSNHEPSGLPDVASDSDLLIDGEYVARLRAFYGSDFDGLVCGENAADFGISLGFECGDWIVSDAAGAVLTRDETWVAMLQHVRGNWGDASPETAEANFHALQYGSAIRSAYHTPAGIRFTVITNLERACNTIQLEHEPAV